MSTSREALIEVQSVSKKFCRSLKRSLWYGVTDIGRELMGQSDSDRTLLRKGEFLAVDDVSFRVSPGQSVALMGRNGAGKSTLLKLINGLIKPDAGSIKIRGRIGALIELGTGFNPLLTGRENIYVNASVLGIRRREVDRRLDAIIEFAEVGDFIDMPLRSYSSGMRVRLGFAVGAQIQPDVLLIDEVLAVGDAAFRVKCYRRLSELIESGTAFILVSHNHHTLLSVCQTAVGLDKGRMIGCGPVREVLNEYERRLGKSDDRCVSVAQSHPSAANSGFRITDIFWRDSQGRRCAAARTGMEYQLCVACDSQRPVANVSLEVMLRESSAGTTPVLAFSSGQDDDRLATPGGAFEYRLALQPVGLMPGSYAAKISLNRPPLHVLDFVETFTLDVEPGLPTSDSLFFNPHRWQIADHQQLGDEAAGCSAVRSAAMVGQRSVA